MKRFLSLAGGALILLLVGLAALPFLIPNEVYRTQIERAASQALGRDVAVTGRLDLALLPELSAGVGGVRIANPEGFSRDTLLEAGELRGVVRLWPLFSGRVEVAEIVFNDADVLLERRADGTANWTFAPGAGDGAPSGETAPSRQAGGNGAPAGRGVDAGIDRARLANATVRYVDRGAGTDLTLSGLDLTARLQGLDAPLDVTATGRLQDTDFDLEVETASPLDLAGAEGSATRIALASDLLDLAFEGRIAAGGESAGTVSLSSEDLRGALALAGVTLAPGDTLRRVSVEGDLTGSPRAVTLDPVSLRLDDVAADGRLGVRLDGPRPAIRGALAFDTLDLSPFLGGEGDGGAPAGAAGEGWSSEPLDLAALRTVDADLALQAGTLRLGQIEASEADLSVVLKAGRLQARLNRAGVFGGAWSGEAMVSARGQTPSVALDVVAETIAIEQALTTLAGLQTLSGTGRIGIDVTSAGASLDALVRGLDGSVSGRLTDGAVRGFNLGQLVRSKDTLADLVRQGAVGDSQLREALSPEAETDFTSLDLSLDLTDGLARLTRFDLVNPVLSISGEGRIDLGARRLDVGLVPLLDTEGTAQGSALQLNGQPIPVRITGDWSAPRIAPDMAKVQAILAADARTRLSESLGKTLREELGSEGAAVLEGLLGPGSEPAGASAEPAAPDPESLARDALGAFLSRQREAREREETGDSP